jgi:hypothetical protein
MSCQSGALAAVTARAREAAVLEIYRLGRITSGRAAVELGMERWCFLALASSRGIATLQTTPSELREEADSLDRGEWFRRTPLVHLGRIDLLGLLRDL